MKQYLNTQELMTDIQDQLADEARFETKLLSKYPDLFPKDTNGSPAPPDCGISCPSGWESLVESLCSSIDHRVNFHHIHIQKRVLLFNAYNFVYTRFVRHAIKRILFVFNPDKQYEGKPMLTQTFNELRAQKPRRYALHTLLRKLSIKLYPRYTYDYKKIPPVKIDQIKEKFGTLRFYYSGGDEVISGMVMLAEFLSGKTCQHTGQPGDLCVKKSGYRWYKTLCPEEAKKHNYEKHNETTNASNSSTMPV